MGGSQSIDNSILGKSLIGKIFCTKDITCFSGHGYANVYSLNKWNDESFLLNPVANQFDLKVSSPIKFKIISLAKTWSIENSDTIEIKIQILNNIAINTIEEIREGTYTQRWIILENWTLFSNKFCPPIYNNNLITHGLDCRLSVYYFGFKFVKLGNSFDINSPYISFNTDLLELIDN